MRCDSSEGEAKHAKRTEIEKRGSASVALVHAVEGGEDLFLFDHGIDRFGKQKEGVDERKGVEHDCKISEDIIALE